MAPVPVGSDDLKNKQTLEDELLPLEEKNMQFLSNKCLTEASDNKETNVHHTDHDVIGLIPSMLRCRGDDTNGIGNKWSII